MGAVLPDPPNSSLNSLFVLLFVLPVSTGTRTMFAATAAAARRITGVGAARGLPAENQISAVDNIQNRRGANDNYNNRF